MAKKWLLFILLVIGLSVSEGQSMLTVGQPQHAVAEISRVSAFEYGQKFVRFFAVKLGLVEPFNSRPLPVLSEELIHEQFAKKSREHFAQRCAHHYRSNFSDDRASNELVMARDYLLGYLYVDWLGVKDACNGEDIILSSVEKKIKLLQDRLDGVYDASFFDRLWAFTERAQKFLETQAASCLVRT